jgi:hypothetical protein
LLPIMDLLYPGCMGTNRKTKEMAWSKAAQRYCDYHMGDDGHWTDVGRTNTEELNARLAAVSFKRTREDVAPWLPKSERRVILCNGTKDDMAKYRRLEKELAPKLNNLLSDPDRAGGKSALEQLVHITTAAKIPTAVERARYWMDQGEKILIFSHMHSTTDALLAAMRKEFEKEDAPVALEWVDGRKTGEKRREAIARWRSGSAGILLAGTQAAGIGIDLSDAAVSIFVELEWVPADAQQAEDRTKDVHLGKRKTPPLYEYLIVKDTIDTAMIEALLSKMRDNEAIVGNSEDAKDLVKVLGEVGGTHVGLPSTDKATVTAALLSIRDRILGGTKASEQERVAVGIMNDIEDEEVESDDFDFEE